MQNKLPADPSALIIGIIGIVVGIGGCCCYGFTAIIPLVLSIWGLVEANKSIKLYEADPSVYSQSSRSNVGISKILNIISIVMNSLLLLIVVAFIAFMGVAGMQGAFDDIKEGAYPRANEWEYEEGDLEIEELEIDSLETKNIFIEEVAPETTDTID